MSDPAGLGDQLRSPPVEALRTLADGIAARGPGHAGECELEASLRQLAETPELPEAMRQRLWAQVVAVQRRLDVHDPGLSREGGNEWRRSRSGSPRAGLPKAARLVAKRQLRNLRGMSATHHDYATVTGHLRFMAELPWRPEPPPPLSIARVEEELNREHTGLDKAKQRVLEYFAVRTLGGSPRARCSVSRGLPAWARRRWPGRWLARWTARTVRVALGGVHDESEIRGHRLSLWPRPRGGSSRRWPMRRACPRARAERWCCSTRSTR